MRILAIDPGNVQSAIVEYCSTSKEIFDHAIYNNVVLLTFLSTLCTVTSRVETVVIEKIASYGMPVGETIFETVFWSGRFAQAVMGSVKLERIERKEVKLHLCGTPRAKDGNVRQTLIDRFGPQGTKKKPGVLYGIKKDQWAALAVAVTWADKYANNSND